MRKLTSAAIHDCIEAVLDNAESLTSDAATLLEDGRFPRALALGVLAIEEIGKVPFLLVAERRTRKGQGPDWKFLDRLMRGHQWKLRMFYDGTNQFKGLGTSELIQAYAEEMTPERIEGLVRHLDRFKQKALYVSIASGRPEKPDEVINEGLARLVIAVSTKAATLYRTIHRLNKRIQTGEGGPIGKHEGP